MIDEFSSLSSAFQLSSLRACCTMQNESGGKDRVTFRKYRVRFSVIFPYKVGCHSEFRTENGR